MTCMIDCHFFTDFNENMITLIIIFLCRDLQIGKYTGLRSAVILGGDSMEEQFAALHESPDMYVCHICLKCNIAEFVAGCIIPVL